MHSGLIYDDHPELVINVVRAVEKAVLQLVLGLAVLELRLMAIDPFAELKRRLELPYLGGVSEYRRGHDEVTR